MVKYFFRRFTTWSDFLSDGLFREFSNKAVYFRTTVDWIRITYLLNLCSKIFFCQNFQTFLNFGFLEKNISRSVGQGKPTFGGCNITCSSVSGSQYKHGRVFVFLNKLSSRLAGLFSSSIFSSVTETQQHWIKLGFWAKPHLPIPSSAKIR